VFDGAPAWHRFDELDAAVFLEHLEVVGDAGELATVFARVARGADLPVAQHREDLDALTVRQGFCQARVEYLRSRLDLLAFRHRRSFPGSDPLGLFPPSEGKEFCRQKISVLSSRSQFND